MKQFGTAPFQENPLSTNPPISEQFSHDPLLCPNFKNKKHPLILEGGGGNYDIHGKTKK